MANDMLNRRIHWLGIMTLTAAFLAAFAARPDAWAQQPGEDATGPTAVAPPSDAPDEAPADADSQPNTVAGGTEGINFVSLLFKGGFFMIPIVLMSFLVVTFVIERFIGLRRTRVIPDELVEALGQLGGPKGGFDPRKAYRLCQQFPSAASNVIRSMLLKVGRPPQRS